MISGTSSLVVHHYAPTSSKDRRKEPLPNEELLSRGHDLVSAVETGDKWRPACSPFDAPMKLGETLIFSKSPPKGPDRSSLRQDSEKAGFIGSPKQWFVSNVSEPRERPVVSACKEFEGTDFSYLLGRKSSCKKTRPRIISQLSGKGKRKREHNVEEDKEDEEREKKRRPISDTAISLYDLIPYPHHHPYSPISADQRPKADITKRFPPFSKVPFTPIPPFTQDRLQNLLKDPFARSAWIVPLDGRLPWKGSSCARLVDNSTIKSGQSNRVPTALLSITWTPFVINKFWSDLIEIRRQAILGAISLSFHVASPDKAKSGDPMGSLDQCAYVKVYHDARYAMYVRSVLDAWRTEAEVPPTSIASRVTTSPRRSRTLGHSSTAPLEKIKCRPLQGAKLVLLDEAGQAVGIC